MVNLRGEGDLSVTDREREKILRNLILANTPPSAICRLVRVADCGDRNYIHFQDLDWETKEWDITQEKTATTRTEEGVRNQVDPFLTFKTKLIIQLSSLSIRWGLSERTRDKRLCVVSPFSPSSSEPSPP